MKRILLGLAMVSSLALMAAQANAAAPGECGKSYAMTMHGTEPALTNDATLHYIVGIGQITFGAAGTAGPTGCAVTHLEIEYNDNAVNTFNAGPATCDSGDSLLGTGIPCFDGGDHQNTAGTLTFSTFGNGAATLAIDPSFSWVNGGPGTADLPLAFTLQGSSGAVTALGSSVPDFAGPTSAPPASPVLDITLQKQSTTVTLPVNGGASGYGTAPYLGLNMSLFEGYGAPHSDPFALPGISGAFGSTISALQIFANGQAGGSASFSTNDNVGNTTGATENDCDSQVTQESNNGDGTSHNLAVFVHPSANCGDAAAGAGFAIDTVQWGTTDTNSYETVGGLEDTADTANEFIPSGDIANAIGLASAPAGKLSVILSPAAETDSGPTFPQTKGALHKITNTSPAGCDMSVGIAHASGTGSECSAALSGTTALSEGDTATTPITVNCTCTSKSVAETDTYTVTTTSSDCPDPATGGSILFTCKN